MSKKGLGSISYTAPQFTFGSNMAVNGGYNFDLPLATVQSFTNQAMAFSTQNTMNAQAFLSGTVNQTAARVEGLTQRTFDQQDKTLNLMDTMHARQIGLQRYQIKKTGRSGCFITTAICELDGKPDDCEELQLLRKFRDRQVAEVYPEAITQYYAVAPTIVERLKTRPNREAVYRFLRDAYLVPAIAHIKAREFDHAYMAYVEMVKVAGTITGVEVENV